MEAITGLITLALVIAFFVILINIMNYNYRTSKLLQQMIKEQTDLYILIKKQNEINYGKEK